MARKFLGSNAQTNTRSLFNSRAKYRNYAIPERLMADHPGIFRNFWFIENMYYGRIDPDHRIIVPNRNKLKIVPGNEGASVTSFDFVSNAFEAFLADYNRASSTGKIRGNQALNEVSPEKGYISALKSYDLHLNRIGNQVRFRLNRNHRNIDNFGDYLNNFLHYAHQVVPDMPITFSGFLSSRYSSPLSTGLFIDLSSADYGDDAEKINNFIDSSNFRFFVKNCQKHGFMIDKNIPWRICANVGSAEMGRHMESVGTNFETVFEEYYSRPYNDDMRYFMRYMTKYYNSFIAAKPFTRKEAIVGGKVHRYSLRRRRVTAASIEKKYSEEYKIDLYIDLRNRETGQRYDGSLLDRLKENAIDIIRRGPEHVPTAYEYIDRSFKGFLNDTAAFNGVEITKATELSGENHSGQKLQDVLRASVAESRRTIY